MRSYSSTKWRACSGFLALALLSAQTDGGSFLPAADGDAPVRLIVLLNSSPLSIRLEATKAGSAGVRAEKHAVEADRQAVILGLKRRGLIQEVYHEFGYLVNGFAATARARDREAIAALPEVQSVYADQEIELGPEFKDSGKVLSASYPVIEYEGQVLTGKGTTIAIIDTGIDYTHPDLGGCFGPGCKVIGGFDVGENDPDPRDELGHGTHVAGIAAANGGMLGMAPDASLLAYKIFSSQSCGSVSKLIAALEKAADPDGDPATNDRPDVINMSLGYEGGPDSPGALAVDRAVELGIVVVSAAGNLGPVNGGIVAPGSSAKGITVGAPRLTYGLFKGGEPSMLLRPSRGPVGDFLPKPDLVASGQNIRSTIMGGGYESYGGTSMASPYVAGAAALLRQAHQTWMPDTVKASLMNTAVASYSDPFALGCGMVDVEHAVRTRFTVIPGIITFGRIAQTTGQWRRSSQLSITNLTTESRAYDLTAQGVYQHRESMPLPGITLAVSPTSLTLEPGATGSATVEMVVDLEQAPLPIGCPFAYYGRVQVAGGDQHVSVPLVVGRVPAPPPEQWDNVLRILAAAGADWKENWRTLWWEGHLVGLNLRENDLKGPISQLLLRLPSLTYLNLAGNSLTGGIPPQLAELPDLEWLDLRGNQLSGQIPAQLGNMKSLQGLLIGDSQLTGAIPSELGQLTRLESLDLGKSELTGQIPSFLTQLPELVDLELSGNQLTGTLPASLASLTNLEWLALGENRIEGPIPASLAQMTPLVHLDLSRNLLSGIVPRQLAELLNVEYLDLGQNRLEGALPSELGQLRLLSELRLGGNRFTGRIPLWLTQLSGLEVLDLSSNLLTGPIPPEISRLDKLTRVNLSGNHLTGVIPPELCSLSNLSVLNLAHNRLGGPIPPEIGNLAKLTSLDLSYNHFSGAIPETLTKLGLAWTGLNLASNHLTSDRPTVLAFINERHVGGSTWVSSQSPWPAIPGDLNGDGVKDVVDLVSLLRLVLQLDVCNPDTAKAGDRNGDQAVDAMDLRLLVPRSQP